MRHDRFVPGLAVLVAAALLIAPARAGERPTLDFGTLQPSDPCTFYRGQAYGRGIEHYATEMLWACEAIAARRAAALPLGDRLEAAAAAIERYRAGVVARATGAFGRPRGRVAAARLGLSETAARALADSTGALVALEGIRTGF